MDDFGREFDSRHLHIIKSVIIDDIRLTIVYHSFIVSKEEITLTCIYYLISKSLEEYQIENLS